MIVNAMRSLVLLVLVALASPPAAGQDSAGERLRQRSLLVLRTALDAQERWVKVHAAEALLSVGAPEGVTRTFEIELASKGREPEYRIGIWRVLAQASRGSQREQWTRLILGAFLDTHGPDRLHAVETLAKLGYRIGGRDTDAFDLVAGSGRGAFAVNARWVLANSGRANGESQLVELLSSDDAGTRNDAAYAVRYLPRLSSDSWKKLAAAVGREPAGSSARVSLTSAAFVHAPASEKPRLKADLLKYAETGTNDETYEVCAALARGGRDEDLPLLNGLLDSRDPDVRVGAAHAILRIGRR